MTRAQWLDDAKQADPADVAGRLGLDSRGRRQVGCPACRVERRGGADRRLPASWVSAERWRCWACNKGGDVIDLVSYALTGDRYRGQPAVRSWWTGSAEPVARMPTKRAEAFRPTYIPLDELGRFLRSLRRLGEAEAAWVRERVGDMPDGVHMGALRPGADRLPRWAGYRGRSWADLGHTMILPTYDPSGVVRGVRARRVLKRDDTAPKALPPAGFSSSGLVLANVAAVALLRCESKAAEVVVCEGEPALLAWTLGRPQAAVFGIGSGWWTKEHAAKIPTGSRVIIATDNDKAGNRYADQVQASLGGRCDLRRWT